MSAANVKMTAVHAHATSNHEPLSFLRTVKNATTRALPLPPGSACLPSLCVKTRQRKKKRRETARARTCRQLTHLCWPPVAVPPLVAASVRQRHTTGLVSNRTERKPTPFGH
jgi:hypothetical protein